MNKVIQIKDLCLQIFQLKTKKQKIIKIKKKIKNKKKKIFKFELYKI